MCVCVNCLIGVCCIDTVHFGGNSSTQVLNYPCGVLLQALSEVLLSVDRAMQKIHDEATLQGGTYTSQQRAALQ